jgi:hypothetical protein
MEKTGDTINNAGESQIEDHESNLTSENHNEAAEAGYKDNPYFSDCVPLHRTMIDSCGRRSMAYFHKPTGKVIPDTERSDAPILTQSLRDDNRRQDILQCWMLCEGVRPQILRQGLQYLMKPMYWFSVILSLFVFFWDSYQEHKALHAEGKCQCVGHEEAKLTQSTSEVEPCTDDEFSNLVALEETALDAYGQRSMAFLNKKTGAVLTCTDLIEHDALDPPMRKYRRRLDIACCWSLCENIRPEILQKTLRAMGLPFFCVFLGVNYLLLGRDVKRERKES